MGSEFGTAIRRLREQAHLSQEELAGLAGISREWLAKIESGRNPSLGVVVKVAAALARHRPGITIADLFEGYEETRVARSTRPRPGPYDDYKAANTVLSPHEVGWDDALSLGAWIESTNTTDELVEHLDTLKSIATRDHVYLPPPVVLTRVLQIHHQIRAALQGGRQRLRQARDLFRIDAGLLAHICLLLGDMRRDDAAGAYGRVALLAATEAGCSAAETFSALAQIARWRHRYAEAADLASRGFAASFHTPIRVLLACQEANAAALAGDARRARQALIQAEAARANLTTEDLDSMWSCPPARYALYRVSVALHTGDATTALREAAAADAAWTPSQPKPFGSWAHLRIAAGHASLMSGSLDGAAEQIAPVLELPSEYRLATLTEHMATVEQLLLDRRFRGSADAGRLRERIREFNRNPVWSRQ